MGLAQNADEARARLAELSAQGWIANAVGAAVEAGIVEALDRRRTAAELAEETGAPAPLALALADTLIAAGLADRDGDAYVPAPGLSELLGTASPAAIRADQRAGLLQMSAMYDAAVEGRLGVGWSHTDPRILEAQGFMSAAGVGILETRLFPALDGLVERLDSGDGAFLDVGAGVAAVTIELCRRHPRLRAVGLEPFDQARQIAERHVREAGLADRIEIRPERIEELEAEAEFDLVWLPGNFLGEAILPSALAVAFRAMRPGGYLLNGSLAGGGDDAGAAAARLRAVLWGGDTVAPERIAELLEAAGFADVVLMPRMPSGLVPMYARRP